MCSGGQVYRFDRTFAVLRYYRTTRPATRMPETLNNTTKKALHSVSVATLTTCLFKRGFRNQYIQNVVPLNPAATPVVGPAFTLRYIPAREDIDKLSVFEDRQNPQRAAIENCPEGAVLVIDSRQDARAASAGSILITRLMKRRAAGIVTDGGFRDSDEIAQLDFASYHCRPSPPTNLTLHHAVDVDVPIGCGGAPVYPGDIVVGDTEGVVIIPAHLADEIVSEAAELTAYEDFVLEEVREGASIPGLYPSSAESRKRFAAWQKKSPE